MIYNNILETIGNTPVVRINKLAPEHVNLFVKIEFFNPMASVKDRLAIEVGSVPILGRHRRSEEKLPVIVPRLDRLEGRGETEQVINRQHLFRTECKLPSQSGVVRVTDRRHHAKRINGSAHDNQYETPLSNDGRSPSTTSDKADPERSECRRTSSSTMKKTPAGQGHGSIPFTAN